jgi:hypothetical protein
VEPLVTSDVTETPVNPLLVAAQFVPLLLDRNTPPPEVPKRIFAPLTIKDLTLRLVIPVFTGFQLEPLLVERYTPNVFVPAKILVPLTHNERAELGKPVLAAVQFAPLFEDKNTLLGVPAKTLAPLTARESTFILVSPVLTAVQLVPLLVE